MSFVHLAKAILVGTILLARLGLTQNVSRAHSRAGRNACCAAENIQLSPREMKGRVRRINPVSAPPFGKDVRVKGAVIFVVGFDRAGNVNCVRLITGHPLLVPPAMESLRTWKFDSRGESACGRLVLWLSTLESNMGLRVLETEPDARRPQHK